MWRRIRHIIIKEFIQVFRDKKLRFFLIVPPLVQLLTYGYVVNFDIKHVAVAVFDESRTMESRQLIDRFASNDWFNVKYFVKSQKGAAASHRPGRHHHGPVVPVGFRHPDAPGQIGKNPGDRGRHRFQRRPHRQPLCRHGDRRLQPAAVKSAVGPPGAGVGGPVRPAPGPRAPGLVQPQPRQPLFHGARGHRHGGAAGQPDAAPPCPWCGKKRSAPWSRSW